jgi:hypothetical protein
MQNIARDDDREKEPADLIPDRLDHLERLSFAQLQD